MEYDYISDFTNGFGVLEKDGKRTLINKDYLLIHSTQDFEAVNIYDNIICIQSLSNFKYGLAGIDGNILVYPEYSSPIEFSEELAPVLNDNKKAGFIDKTGAVVVEFNYDWGTPFHDGLAAVGNQGYFYFINADGEVISGPFEDLGLEVYTYMTAYAEYSEGHTAFFKPDTELPAPPYGGGKGGWGFLDKQGKISIAPRYMFVRPFHEGLAAVETEDGMWIYINTSGKTVMKGAPADFFNGLACMGDRFIDKKGETVIKIPQGYSLESSTQKGFDNFYLGDLIIVYEEQNGQKAIMNKQGKIILESRDFDDMKIFRDNYVAVKKNGMWGIINLDKH